MQETKAMPHNGGYIPQIGNKILCMPQGGPIKYTSELAATVHARRFVEGWTGSAFLMDPKDVI